MTCQIESCGQTKHPANNPLAYRQLFDRCVTRNVRSRLQSINLRRCNTSRARVGTRVAQLPSTNMIKRPPIGSGAEFKFHSIARRPRGVRWAPIRFSLFIQRNENALITLLCSSDVATMSHRSTTVGWQQQQPPSAH